MVEQLKGLSEEEQRIMLEAPVLVSILIAGADKVIEKKEIKEAIAISNIKKKSGRKILNEYFEAATDDYEKKLRAKIAELPVFMDDALKDITGELEKLNDILPKLDKEFAAQFHASLKDIAKHVAEASGGVLGYAAVGYEESKLIDLKMIKQPV